LQIKKIQYGTASIEGILVQNQSLCTDRNKNEEMSSRDPMMLDFLSFDESPQFCSQMDMVMGYNVEGMEKWADGVIGLNLAPTGGSMWLQGLKQ